MDDERALADAMRELLEIEGYRAVVTYESDKALDAIRLENPDLLLLDVGMPRVSGLDLCRMVRNDTRLAGLPVIMVSAMAVAEDVQAGLAAGADGYLKKPFTVAKLLESVQQVLGPPIPA